MLKAKAVLAAVAVAGLSAGLASADVLLAFKMKLKTADPAKQQAQVHSKDLDVELPTDSDRPTIGAASLHIYGGGGLDLCQQLPKTSWEDKGNKFQYKDAQKNKAQIKDYQLKVKLKGALGIVATNPFSPVNMIFRSGAGYEHCMVCSSTTDQDGKFKANFHQCLAATCDPEPGTCEPASPSGAFLD